MDLSSATLIIDTAVHLWDAATYHRMHGDWLDTRPELKRSWLPADLEHELAACGVRQAVIIEAAPRPPRAQPLVAGVGAASPFSRTGSGRRQARTAGPGGLARRLCALRALRRDSHHAGRRALRMGRIPPPPGAGTELRDATAVPRTAGRLAGLRRRRRAGRRLPTPARSILDHCGMPPPGSAESGPPGRRDSGAAQRPNVTVKYASRCCSTPSRCATWPACARRPSFSWKPSAPPG